VKTSIATVSFAGSLARIDGYDGYGAYNSFVRLASLRSNAQQKALND
jgi:hypothetical protein